MEKMPFPRAQELCVQHVRTTEQEETQVLVEVVLRVGERRRDPCSDLPHSRQMVVLPSYAFWMSLYAAAAPFMMSSCVTVYATHRQSAAFIVFVTLPVMSCA